MFDWLSDALVGDAIQDHNVPCAVCKINRALQMMLPAKNVCYQGWTLEYKGYLVAQSYGHAGKTEYVCLDESPEKDEAGHRNENGALMYKTVAKCGSLPCPKYEEKRVLTCAICSM